MNLTELVESGDLDGVLSKLRELTSEQRTAQAAELEARYQELSTVEWLALPDTRKVAHHAAELGGKTTPEAAAAWLVIQRDIGSWRSCGWMLRVVDLHPDAWKAELVAQLASGTRLREDAVFALAEHIIRDIGCPLPTTNLFIHAWLEDRMGTQVFPVKREEHIRSGGQGANLLEKLRKDDFTPTLLPLAVARPAIGIWKVRTELASLAAEGVLDRGLLSRRTFVDLTSSQDTVGELEEGPLTADEHVRMAPERRAEIERDIARLLQDGTRKETIGPLTSLRSLAPTLDEHATHLRDHVAMLDLSLPVATYAHGVLSELDDSGILEPDVLSEVGERVLLRPEKKLVRAHLSWLDRVARRDPARLNRLLLDAASAFHHPDAGIQERALKLVARHLNKADDTVLPELRASAEGVSPQHSARAAELFGPLPEAQSESQDEPYTEMLPPVPEPRPVPGPIETAAEVAHEVATVLADDQNVVAFERALDGLVRHARLDRCALSEALEPVLRNGQYISGVVCTQDDLYDVAAAVRGDEPRAWHIHLRATHPAYGWLAGDSAVAPSGDMLKARLTEAIEVIETGIQPFLLAVPTLATGALDATVLTGRIAELEALGITPSPIDLAQALLRVTPTADEQVKRTTDELNSDAGRQLARWLHDGGLPHQDSTPQWWPVTDPTNIQYEQWGLAHPGVVTELSLPRAASDLIGPKRANGIGSDYVGAFWLAQLPHHRDEVVARMYEITRPGRVLPYTVESGGPAGFAVHWWIADAIVAEFRRTSWIPASCRAGVDALLVLAAREQLNSRLLGEQLHALLRLSEGAANRVHNCLREAAETGAYATVWAVLEAALPGLLRDRPVRGAGALLSLAAECATRCGATGRIAEVDAVTARKGSTQTVKNARLLRDVLR